MSATMRLGTLCGPFCVPFQLLSRHHRGLVKNTGLSLCLVSYNVLSLSDGARDVQQGLHGAVGRPTLLQQSKSEFGAHVVGLQECRTPQGRARIGAYTRFCSGCDAKSCFGVELWVSDTGPAQPPPWLSSTHRQLS